MSSSNIPPIPPIPSFPPLPPSEQPAENKRRWWLWGLIGCGGLIVGIIIIGIVAAIAIPLIIKARTANQDRAAYQGQTTMMADQGAAQSQAPAGQEQALLPESVMPERPGQGTVQPATPLTGQEPTVQPTSGPTVGPGWLPAYPNARNVTQVGGTPEAGWNTGGLSYATSDTEQTVIRFYRERLTPLGIAGQQSYDEATKNHMYNAQTSDGSRYVSVGASRVGNTTIVGIGYRSKN